MCIRTLCCASLVAYIYTESACCPLLESWKLSVWNCPDTCFIWIILSSTFTFTFHFPFHMFRILIFNIASSYRPPYHSLYSIVTSSERKHTKRTRRSRLTFSFNTRTWLSLVYIHSSKLDRQIRHCHGQSFLYECRQSSPCIFRYKSLRRKESELGSHSWNELEMKCDSLRNGMYMFKRTWPYVTGVTWKTLTVAGNNNEVLGQRKGEFLRS